MAEYTYKQWENEQNEANNIHADDCYRWQAGIEAAGGTWDGTWVDHDTTGVGTITADQLNALEQEIADLYGSGFTAKTFEDGNIPGTAEWNRIEDAINTILNRTAFAIYCETDNSLTFYVDTEVPAVGDTYDGKVVAEVYTGLENTNYTSAAASPFYELRLVYESVTIDSSFKLCKPVSMLRWFNGYENAKFSGLANIDTSKVTTFNRVFYTCYELTDANLKDVAAWDISSATNFSYMFYGCSGLTNLEPLANWDTSNVTSLEQMFNNCRNVESIDVSKWNTAKVTNLAYIFNSCLLLIEEIDLSGWDTSNVTNMNYVFSNCSALKTVYVAEGQFNTDKVTSSTGMFQSCSSIVGGNGTAFDSSKIDASMAHIDTEDNPGYFTAKG